MGPRAISGANLTVWRRAALLALVVLAGVLLALAGASTARAAFGFVAGETSANAYKADGTTLETQAGATPHTATTVFELNSTLTQVTPTSFSRLPDENVKDIQVDLPTGFVGDPNATPKCPREVLPDAFPNNLAPCPPSTQVGTVKLWFGSRAATATGGTYYQFPVYNMVPRKGDLVDLTFVVVSFGGTHVIGSVRQNDFGVRTSISNLSALLPLVRTEMSLWGVPADPVHNAQRGMICANSPLACFNGGQVGGAAPRAFLRNPVRCDGTNPVTEFKVRSWREPTTWLTDTASGPPLTGCEKTRFTASFGAKPEISRPDAPSGLSVDIGLPQNDDPKGLGTPPMKKAVVTLPPGMSVNPASASGLVPCTDPALNLGKDVPVSCPDASKIGDVEATTPVLSERLTGGIYLRPQASNDPESGELFRVALVLESKERGLSIRLPGSIRADKVTGQLTTTFDNNPQMPVDRVKLRFKSGPRAPLATPAACGRHTVNAELSSWAGQTANLNSTFDIDCVPGLGGFTPSFVAGTALPVAGAHSPFSLSIAKPDNHHALTGVNVALPPGLLANLKGRIGSQVGTVTAFAGPGGSPYPLPGRVYLEGPYGDAPFSLKVVVPAVAGPFDLGEVVVRQRIHVDRRNAQVSIASDPLPTIVSGVPVRLQRLDVNVDAPGFMVNPTSCAPTTVHADLSSAAGQVAQVSTRFQVGECASKPLEPKLAMQFTDRAELRRNKHPGVRADLGAIPGHANLKQVRVALPLAVALDPNNAKALCPPEGPAAGACPDESIIGHARATTPLLDVPVEGPVYFVKGTRIGANGRVIATLPKLYVRLSGQGVTIDLHADSSVSGPTGKQKLVTTFKELPDVALDQFSLRINGGPNGVLKATADVCGASTSTQVRYTGHNGRVTTRTITAGVEGCRPQIVSSSHTDSHLSVRVGGIGPGTLRLTGSRIATGIRTIRGANAATIRGRLNLTASQKQLLRQGRTVKTAVRVRYKPTKGKAVTVRKTVSIKGVKRGGD